MLKSMTGYGRAFESNSLCDIKVEIKSVNSKYCDINIRLPRVLSLLEIPLRALVQEKLVRGKIDVNIDVRFQKPVQAPILNRQNFVSSINVLEQMKTLGGLNDEITLDHLLKFNELIEYDVNPQIDEFEAAIKRVLTECLDKIDSMRLLEGENLKNNIIDHLALIDNLAKNVDSAKNDIFLYWVDRFKSRLAEFGQDSASAQERIIQEASIYAEKADIKEELTRIYSHHKQFHTIMSNEFPCGKKLDFLCQELYREWNTIASKSLKADIINIVVEAKAAVDSIREQIQNVV